MNIGYSPVQHGLLSTRQVKAMVVFMALSLFGVWLTVAVDRGAQQVHAQVETATQEKFETASK